MTDGDHRNHIEGDRLWDADGNEWTRHVRWLTLAQARSFVRRGRTVGLMDAEFTMDPVDGGFARRLGWMDPVEARQWWEHGRMHFEVPGSGQDAPADGRGHTWAAHLWRRGTERLIIFETFC
jgi:hypothetical protein